MAATRVSIHLMLQFISLFATAVLPLLNVSIHLMLQFIFMLSSMATDPVSFNTSHVVVYPFWQCIWWQFKHVSIHLMLQFIGGYIAGQETLSEFQYISCCSLSMEDETYFIRAPRFNTSHVVVYRGCQISSAKSRCQFQYISCCSLSLFPLPMQGLPDCFNTSHVVVYRS